MLALAIAVSENASAANSSTDAATSLHGLELLIPSTLTLQAAAARIDAADDVLDRIRADAGLHYFAQSALGPRSDVVSIAYGNNTIFRYLQRFGVSLPLLGTRDRQQEDIRSARTDGQLRRIDFAAEQRVLLATLREGYVQYWLFAREGSIAQRFLGLDQDAVKPARSLRSVGFWTQANLLAFLDELDRVKTDVSTLRDARGAALEKLRAIAGESLGPFDPPDPDLASQCPADKDRAVASALATDDQLQRFSAQIAQREDSLNMVHWSSVDAAVELGIGGYTDAPRGLGDEFTLDLNINVPRHRKLLEGALAKGLQAEITAFEDDAAQRRRELTSNVGEDLANLDGAQATLAHAMVDTSAKDEALRVARVRFTNLPSLGAAAFEDVQARTAQAYASERAVMDARAQVYFKTNDLLLLAPNACAAAVAKVGPQPP